MPRAFSGGNDVVMAVGALIRGLAVVNGLQRGSPGIGGMTTITQIAGQRMGDGLKGGPADTVMTTALGASLPGDQGVIEYGTQPAIGVMTRIAG